jgi:tetratricopeptide (TPR) repeat protein
MARPTGSRSRVVWGEPPSGGFVPWLQSLFVRRPHPAAEALPSLPLALRRGELAERYLAAEGEADHPRAGAAAIVALEEAVAIEAWWPADIWGHRALWHFERAGMELAATRAARTIGEVRWAAGDPASARRYYAEAISEARDIGAEREEGLAALGLGRAELDLGNVTVARRLGQIAIDLFERCGAPDAELAAARDLRGEEKEVSGA